ncbi:uncharacterized protein [Spinacia oleracea]|uniref:Uncharacterized protein isoform X2 n=1 Tax=Spinacia oleracea TaxID=3562 RepID=A0ABM3QVP8_SPIOL|nr:uncharacterized protein LOC110780121 isoform X2 [Spinacia oleracea]
MVFIFFLEVFVPWLLLSSFAVQSFTGNTWILFYIEDTDVDFKDIIEASLPKAPLDTSIMCHWVAIEGVQPASPENAPVQDLLCLLALLDPASPSVYVHLLSEEG